MKFLKNFKSFKLNEDKTQTNSNDLNVVVVVKTVNTKERVINSLTIKSIAPSSLAERGAELINQAVMKKGENPESLDLNIDSEKLEYAWRMISKDVDGALKNGKIEKDGKVVAFNIKKNDNGVVFDFTFENSDSTQNTDPSGKTTKNILAGKIEGGNVDVDNIDTAQVWVVLQKNEAVDLSKISTKVEFLNAKRKLLEAGYVYSEGNRYILKQKGLWVSYTNNNNTKVVEFLKSHEGSYFDVKELYTKFGINPSTKETTGNPVWETQIK